MSTKDPTLPKDGEGVYTLAGTIANFFADGWLLMLLFGVLHASAHIVPAFGYWQSAFAAFVLMNIVGSGTWELTQRVKKLGRLVQVQNATGVLSDAISNYLKANKS